MKFVPPSVKETAFNCPHCGVLASQYWHSLHADPRGRNGLPEVIDDDKLKELASGPFKDEKEREQKLRFIERLRTARPFLTPFQVRRDYDLKNAWCSRCHNCDEVSLWITDQMIYPQIGDAPLANPDMPPDIRNDYDEASNILGQSPRGAAALIRLCIQKLCKHLGQPGKSINDDIKELVAGGLDPRIQKALDVVRVVGNHAVHPGQIELKDDRATAESLFRLLNLIVEKMISEPKHVDEVYAALPEEARKAIEKRDGK
ncbi:DUF4145 domain-containing protein [Frigidibacter sp. SD6-1]|uniref:DUF4145 domain-containing protein n=1 Tax=Frigidibacter sp. SD6-1 TaxID=3032581 RepID=UPI0024DF46BD|nr:DUF4145 domain-containing protein [Frigidibacter sp. SD6-1]